MAKARDRWLGAVNRINRRCSTVPIGPLSGTWCIGTIITTGTELSIVVPITYLATKLQRFLLQGLISFFVNI